MQSIRQGKQPKKQTTNREAVERLRHRTVTESRRRATLASKLVLPLLASALMLTGCTELQQAAKYAGEVKETARSVCEGASEFVIHCNLFESQHEKIPDPMQKACELARKAETSAFCMGVVK